MKTIFTFLFCCCTAGLFAQGSLQFNQVKLVTTQETVPAGKVWKVESVIYNIPESSYPLATNTSSSCGSSYLRNYSIEVDGVATKVGFLDGVNSTSSYNYFYMTSSLPIWLPAGATLSGGPCSNKISVIEFNIVP